MYVFTFSFPILFHSFNHFTLELTFAIFRQIFRNLKSLQIGFHDKKSILWAVNNAMSPAISNGILWREKLKRRFLFLASS